MTNNTKELVAAGHALVKEMATLATDHKCFNSAELVRELATQLDVQRARADLLAADNEKALSVLKEANESVLRAKGTIDGLVVENAYLLPKAASELSNAWMLHKYWVGINAALMHIWAGRLSDAVAWLENTVSGPGIDVPRITDSAEIEKWAADQQKDSISHAKALEIIKAETPVTDRYLASVVTLARKQGAYFVANRMLAAWDSGFIEDTPKNVADIARMVLTSEEFMDEAPEGDFERAFADEMLLLIASQLRNGETV